MKKLLAIGLCLFVATTALARPQPLQRYSKYGTVIDALDLSASRSFEINLSPQQLGGVWGLMTAWICVTDNDTSITDVSMACTSSHDGGTTDYELQECSSVSAGVCTSVDASWSKDPDPTTTHCWPWRADIESFPLVTCTFTDTGGDASDTISVVVTFATKG